MKRPFGKYKGENLADIPEDYLVWLLDNCELKQTLRRAVDIALGLCDRQRDPPSKQPATGLTTALVAAWYRRMAMEFHPDHRGTHEGMLAVNRGRELLMELTGL